VIHVIRSLFDVEGSEEANEEIFLAILNIGVVILILYFVIKILKPIDALIER
jgi:hypothetical protein